MGNIVFICSGLQVRYRHEANIRELRNQLSVTEEENGKLKVIHLVMLKKRKFGAARHARTGLI